MILLVISSSEALQARLNVLHPYFGGSVNFAGISFLGWGVEAGAKYTWLYGGIEYGSYGQIQQMPVMNWDPVPGYDLSKDPYFNHNVTPESYYGIHSGFVIDSLIYVGAVALFSHQDEWEFGNVVHNSWFNIGPDIRLQTWDHAMFTFAYTIRRGLNTGLSFLF